MSHHTHLQLATLAMIARTDRATRSDRVPARENPFINLAIITALGTLLAAGLVFSI